MRGGRAGGKDELPQVGGGGRSRSRFSLGSVMESRGLHILDCGYQGPNAESGATTSSQHPQPLLRFGERGGPGRGASWALRGCEHPRPVWGSPPPRVLRLRPRPPVSGSRLSVPPHLSGFSVLPSLPVSESLTPSVSLSPCLGLVQLSVSVLGLSPCLPLSPSLCVSLGLWSLRSQPSSLSLSISAWVFLSLPFLSHLHLCLQAPAPCSSLFPPLFLSLVNSASYTPLSPPLARGDLEEEDPPPPPPPPPQSGLAREARSPPNSAPFLRRAPPPRPPSWHPPILPLSSELLCLPLPDFWHPEAFSQSNRALCSEDRTGPVFSLPSHSSSY